jgi:DUF1009 family protein
VARRLTILAGSGGLVHMAMGAAREAGDIVQVLALTPGAGGPDAVTVDLTDPARIIGAIRGFGATDIIMAGAVTLDGTARLALARFAGAAGPAAPATPQGDIAISSLAGALEALTGARIMAVQDLVPNLLAEAGIVCGPPLSPERVTQCRFAFDTARAVGSLDLGQAAITSGQRVVAVEDIAGTDALLDRVRSYRHFGLLSDDDAPLILAKAVKPNQPRYVDLPAIGPITVERAAAAGVSVIVVEARGTILIDRAGIMAAADAAGICLVGLAHRDG